MDKVKSIEAKNVTKENFAKYGLVLEKPMKNPEIDNNHISYWHNIYDFGGFNENTVASYFICKKIPIYCNSMEKILTNDEIYINLGGGRFVLFLARGNAENTIDENSIEAFVFDCRQSALVRKGIWHLAPFPLHADNEFLLVLGDKNLRKTNQGMIVNEDTVIIKDLQYSYSINV